MTVKEIQQLPISETTASFIHNLKEAMDLYNRIGDSLFLLYGERAGDELLNRDFHPIYKELEDLLQKYMVEAMRDNMASTTATKI